MKPMENALAVLEPRRTALLTIPPGGAGVEIGVHEGAFSRMILRIARPRKL